MNSEKKQNNTTVYGSSFGGNVLVEKIGRAIRDGNLKDGEKLSSIRELSSRFNISYGTARAALGKLESLGLVEKRHGSGTYISYKQQSFTNTAYLMINSREHLYDVFSADLTEQLQNAGIMPVKTSMEKSGSNEQFDQMLVFLKQHPAKAIVIQWDYQYLDQAIREICLGATKVVATFREVSRLPTGWHSVNPDFMGACELAARHFVSIGHKKIGLITYPKKNDADDNKLIKEFPSGNEIQIMGINRALHEAGIYDAPRVYYNQWNEDGHADPLGERNLDFLTKWLSSSDRPTAIMGEDYRILAVKRAAERAGLKIPEDLAVIGLGNTPWSDVEKFSSVSYQETIIAQDIVKVITANENDDTVNHLLIKPKLVIRYGD